VGLLKLQSLRTPQANQISTSIYFHSPKKNRQVWCESNLEWDCAIALDQNPQVLDYCEQSIKLKWSQSECIPDFIALVQKNEEFLLYIIEIKYMQGILAKRDHYIQKYDETKDWILKNQSKIAQTARIKVMVVKYIKEEVKPLRFYIFHKKMIRK
jgi:hypothetical protein